MHACMYKFINIHSILINLNSIHTCKCKFMYALYYMHIFIHTVCICFVAHYLIFLEVKIYILLITSKVKAQVGCSKFS